MVTILSNFMAFLENINFSFETHFFLKSLDDCKHTVFEYFNIFELSKPFILLCRWEELRSKGLHTFALDTTYWLPVNFLNFMFVPPLIENTSRSPTCLVPDAIATQHLPPSA